MSDKKILHIISISTLAALVISFFFGTGGRMAAAILMAGICAVTIVFIKKRGIPNYVYPEIIMLMSVIALVFVMLYYLTGLIFGFARTNYGSFGEVLLRYIIPIPVIIVATELVRNVMRAQEDKAANILSYVSCVVADVLIHYSLADILSFRKFMDIVGMVFLPAVLSNLLYHYLAKRYGVIPNIAYRLIITLHPYIIPYISTIPNSLLAFVNLLVPLAIYIFIDYLYEKKKRYALSRNSKIGIAAVLVLLVLMTLLVMLVSNVFRFGAYVIATESMTGELNKGDIAIYEKYDGQTIEEGQVIVFKQGNSNVIHRVVDIENINGQNRYYTKGDINSENDEGFITDSNIKGLVDNKVPYLGYPTLWLRELVSMMIRN